LSKVLESYTCSPNGISAWYTFNNINGIDPAVLSLAAIKLERRGYLDKTISNDGQEEFYAFSITSDGIDYLLENESFLNNSNQKMKSISVINQYDENIPF